MCLCCVCGVWWWVVAEAHSLQSSALHQAATALGAALPPATVTIQKKSYCQVGGAAAILSRGHRPTALHYCSQSAAFGSRLAEWSAVEHCSSSFHSFVSECEQRLRSSWKFWTEPRLKRRARRRAPRLGLKVLSFKEKIKMQILAFDEYFIWTKQKWLL